MTLTTTLHGTAVALDGRAVLLIGPAGSGKSDLALRLIDRGAILVADDAVRVQVGDAALQAQPLAGAEGRLFVAGIGIVTVSHIARAPLALAIDLTPHVVPAAFARPSHFRLFDDWAVPLLSLDGTRASAPIKVALALARWGL